MQTFLEFFQQQLVEKQIQYNNNANYGQVVFFAGGAASGKGFSIKNFIDHTKFKIRDVDELKMQMLKLDSIKKKYPEIENMSLKNPDDVYKLHMIAKKERIPEKQFAGWFKGMKYPETLPNILFDITMKDLEEVDKYLPMLVKAGYKPENVHITWVLANFQVAIERNKTRERVVPEDIMLLSHTGAALTMANLFTTGLPKGINGSMTVILNNFEEVQYYDRAIPEYEKNKLAPTHGKPKVDSKGNAIFSRVVKDFKYVSVKKSGRPMPSLVEMDRSIRETIFKWVFANAPEDDRIKGAYLK